MAPKRACDDPERKRRDLQVLKLALEGASSLECAAIANTLMATVELRQQRVIKNLRRLYLTDTREDRPVLDMSVGVVSNKVRRANKDTWLTLIERYGEQWINL